MRDFETKTNTGLDEIRKKIIYLVKEDFNNYNSKEDSRDIEVLVTFYEYRKKFSEMPSNKQFINVIVEAVGWHLSTAIYRIKATTERVVRYATSKHNDNAFREILLKCGKNREVTILERFYDKYMKDW